MNISNLHARMVKAVKINQEWNEVKDVTTEIGNVHHPTHPEFVTGSGTRKRYHRVTQESLASKWMMILKSAADTIRFTIQKVILMAAVPLMRRYKATYFSIHKVLSDEGNFIYRSVVRKGVITVKNKLAQVFTSRDFIFVAPMKSKSDGGIGLIDICDDHVIPEELRSDNSTEEPMYGTMIQRTTRNFCIIGRSNEPYI